MTFRLLSIVRLFLVLFCGSVMVLSSLSCLIFLLSYSSSVFISMLVSVLEIFSLSEDEFLRKLLQISLIFVLFCLGVSLTVLMGDGMFVGCSCCICAILCSMIYLPLVLFSTFFQETVMAASVYIRAEMN